MVLGFNVDAGLVSDIEKIADIGKGSKTPALWFCINAFVCLLVLSMFAGSVSAELYKYINDDGVVVLDSQIPARFVKNGYTVLSVSGNVIEVIPRILTAEELAIQEQHSAIEIANARRAEEKKQYDEHLMIMYSSPQEVIDSRNATMVKIENHQLRVEQKLSRLNADKLVLELKFANIERAGGKITAAKFDQIQRVEELIKRSEAEVKISAEDKVLVDAKFALELKRVQELYDKTR